jgi:epoxyqueuosine reductase
VKLQKHSDYPTLEKISSWAQELGFSDLAVVDIESTKDLSDPIERYKSWIDQGFHGEMKYLKDSIFARSNPNKLFDGVKRAIMVSMNYLPKESDIDWRNTELNGLQDPEKATISIYARGKDYHRVMRKRLAKLAKKISSEVDSYGFRACVDSAPLLEVELAQKSGLGWRGKNTLLLRKNEGSFFFLGSLLTDLPLKPTSGSSKKNLCGTCTSCLDKCPTSAFIAPYVLDAKKCISYQTIENKGIIEESLRHLIGNRVYGCDDCQLVCPWNKYAKVSTLEEFDVKNGLDNVSLITLFKWNEIQFLHNHSSSPILRIGYERWLRNIAIGLGNAANKNTTKGSVNDGLVFEIKKTLMLRLNENKPILRPHLIWAIAQCEQ